MTGDYPIRPYNPHIAEWMRKLNDVADTIDTTIPSTGVLNTGGSPYEVITSDGTEPDSPIQYSDEESRTLIPTLQIPGSYTPPYSPPALWIGNTERHIQLEVNDKGDFILTHDDARGAVNLSELKRDIEEIKGLLERLIPHYDMRHRIQLQDEE